MSDLAKVNNFIQEIEPFKDDFINWLESEEERLQRDLSDEELEIKFSELFTKHNVKRI